MSLIVTGTIGIDTIQTPDGQEREGVLGGSGVYFAAAASFFAPTRLVAVVGEDWPDEHRAALATFAGVDASGLETRAGSKTFRWGGRYQDNMDHRDTLFTELGVLEEAPPTVPENFRDSSIVFLANGHPATQGAFLDQLPGCKLSVVDTMDLWIDIAKPDLETLLGRVDGLVLNYDEAEKFTGRRNTITAGKKLLEYGPRFVVIKKGEHGAILVHRDGVSALPAYPAEVVVDPTGAGDSFAGGMLGYIAAHEVDGDPGAFEVIHRAMAYGTVIASFNIDAFTLERVLTLTSEEIEARLAEFKRMVRVE